ncbi:MAG: sporulation integral membrane protein YtvI [Clostridia bacterium]|nr:sporulation integral membrane protein YtvI [Clostridia bacterium]
MNFDYEKQKKFLVTTGLVLAFGCIAYLLIYKFASYVVPFVLALIFAAFLSPAVNLIENKLKINRKIISLLMIILTFLIIGSIVYFIAIEIYDLCVEYISVFMDNASDYTDKISGITIISDYLTKMLRTEINIFEMLKNVALSFSENIVGIATGIAKKLPQLFVASIVFILATYFMVADKDRILTLLFNKKNEKVQLTVDKVKKLFKNSILKYIKAQATILCITFCELLLGFSIMKFLNIITIDHIFIIALGIASLDALPVFGTGTILIPWSLFSLLAGDFRMAIALILMYVICLVVRQLIEPKIVSQNLGIHPLITLVCMYVGLKTIGILGMISFPILAVFVINFYKIFQELKSESKQ